MNFETKLVKHGDLPRIELRAQAGITRGAFANILIVISRNGDTIPQRDYSMPKAYILKEGVNVQLSLNGTAELTWDDWDDLNEAIDGATQLLNDLEWDKVNKGRDND